MHRHTPGFLNIKQKARLYTAIMYSGYYCLFKNVLDLEKNGNSWDGDMSGLSNQQSPQKYRIV